MCVSVLCGRMGTRVCGYYFVRNYVEILMLLFFNASYFLGICARWKLFSLLFELQSAKYQIESLSDNFFFAFQPFKQ